jgi:hypothetical protein
MVLSDSETAGAGAAGRLVAHTNTPMAIARIAMPAISQPAADGPAWAAAMSSRLAAASASTMAVQLGHRASPAGASPVRNTRAVAGPRFSVAAGAAGGTEPVSTSYAVAAKE